MTEVVLIRMALASFQAETAAEKSAASEKALDRLLAKFMTIGEIKTQ